MNVITNCFSPWWHGKPYKAAIQIVLRSVEQRNLEVRFKTKNVLSTSILKEIIGLKMIMSTIGVNSFGGKGKQQFLNRIFDLFSYRFTQISSVGTRWMHN